MLRSDHRNHGSPGLSNRPALTHLVWLAITDRSIVERLLRGDSPDTAIAHPHYSVELDARDRDTLEAIRDRSASVEEFISDLADAADSITP
jgi:hypothetical protein